MSNQLNVNIKNELTGQVIYIVGVTAASRNGITHFGAGGSTSGYFPLTVNVGCGKETVTASIGTKKYAYQMITGTETIAKTDLDGFFTIAQNGAMASCVTTTYSLCTNNLDCDNTLTTSTSAAHVVANEIKVDKA